MWPAGRGVGRGARGRGALQQSPAARGPLAGPHGRGGPAPASPPPGFGPGSPTRTCPCAPRTPAHARHARVCNRPRGTGVAQCGVTSGGSPRRARTGAQTGTGGLDGYRGGAALVRRGFRPSVQGAASCAPRRTPRARDGFRWRVLRARASTRRRGGPAHGRAGPGLLTGARMYGGAGAGVCAWVPTWEGMEDWRMAAAMCRWGLGRGRARHSRAAALRRCGAAALCATLRRQQLRPLACATTHAALHSTHAHSAPLRGRHARPARRAKGRGRGRARVQRAPRHMVQRSSRARADADVHRGLSFTVIDHSERFHT